MGLTKKTLDTRLMPKHKHLFDITIDGINSWQLKSFGRPSFSTNVVETDYKNVKRKYAGKVSWNPISGEINDYIDFSASQQLLTWATAQHNPISGENGTPSVYKKDITITELSNNLVPISQWILVGAWMSEFDGNSLDYSSDEQQTIPFTIQYDYAELIY